MFMGVKSDISPASKLAGRTADLSEERMTCFNNCAKETKKWCLARVVL